MTNQMQKTRSYNEEYISAIQSSADRLGKIINDLLDISKIQSNHMDIQKKS